MKRLSIVTLSLLLFLSSCEKEKEDVQKYSRQQGEEIIFGTVTDGAGTDTKAAYSGTVVSGIERINWENNDTVRIYCPEASEPSSHYEDYFATGVKTYSTTGSQAGVSHNPGSIGLRWGKNEVHHFYSLYPAPGAGVSGTALSYDDTDSATATCVIPSVQKYASLTQSSGNWTAKANPDYMYMVGYATATAGGEGDPVSVSYVPAFTSFQITVTNNFDDKSDMTVKSVSLSTASGEALAATYPVAIDGSMSKKKIGGLDGTSNSISMNFKDQSNNYITVKYGKSLTFTFFVQPKDDIDKLTFRMYDKDETERSIDLKYRGMTDKDWVKFKAFHKSVITGLMAPKSSKWYINLGDGTDDIVLADWNQADPVNVTQVTLKKTDVTFYYYDSKYHDVTGAEVSSFSVGINGEYDSTQSGKLSAEVVDETLKSYCTSPTINSTGSGNKYQVTVTLAGTPDANVNGKIKVNDTNTNSFAEIDVTILCSNPSN